MTAKEYLNQARHLDALINCRLREIDYLRTSCKAKAIPFPTRSVFLKPTQSRTVFPICVGTRTMAILVRTSKDRAFNPCLRILKPGKWLLLS